MTINKNEKLIFNLGDLKKLKVLIKSLKLYLELG